MRRPGRLLVPFLLALVAAAATAPAAQAETEPHGGLFRDPDASATHVVFVYGGRLWTVPREGGTASPLALPDGEPSHPRFAPDGAEVAFVADYDGENDIYVLPSAGGIPRRVTWHPTDEQLDDWHASGDLLFTARGMGGLPRQTRLYRVSSRGGLPEPLPVPYGAHAALDAEGRWLAYDPHGAEPPSWKRYRGGRAADVWLFDLQEKQSLRLTDWEGTDARPMWHGGRVYYVSDRGPGHRLNLWTADPKTGEHRPLTRYETTDVRWPAMGPGPAGEGEIVFQRGDGLFRLDLATEEIHAIPIRIPGDRPALRPRPVDVSERAGEWHPSPHAKRVVVSARGDLWTLPAQKGPPRNLTRTSGVAERSPAWSPDGRWIAYFSDETGAYELWIRRADGREEKRQLTRGGDAWRFRPVWSPDAKRIAHTDKAARLFVTEVEDAETTLVDADPLVEEEGVVAYAWSPDGRWLAYARAAPERRHRSLFLWDGDDGTVHQPTSGMFEEGDPAFDRKGDFLYATSKRHFSPHYGDVDETFIYAESGVLLAFPLRDDVASPLLPESDEVKTEDGAEKKDEKEKDEKHDENDKGDKGDEHDEKGGAAEEGAAADDGVSGTWTGEARAEALGVGNVAFTLVLRVDADGRIASGTLTTPQGDARVVGGRYDAATGALVVELLDEDGLTWRVRAHVTGDRVEGTATLEDLGVALPFEARRVGPAEADAGGGGGSERKTPARSGGAPKPVEIDLEGFEARAFRLPVDPGNFRDLAVAHDGALLYGRRGVRGERGGDGVHRFDPHADDPKEQKVASGASTFVLSADGKHALVLRGRGKAALHRAAAGAPGEAIPTAGMTAWIDPREEWRLLVTDAWRILGDYFYDPTMHGVDWDAVQERALAMLDGAVVHGDVDHVIRDMLGELNVGHANYFPPRDRGGEERAARTGLLGCAFAKEEGAWRIVRFVGGAPWDVDARSVLDRPGVDVREGDWLLAVNGVPLDPEQAPWAGLVGTAGKSTWLTVSEKPVRDDDAREVLVEPLGSEANLHYRAWVEANRRKVEALGQGRVGYVHVPDTGWNGQNELWRQFVGQQGKEALIVDERWNGGGQIPTRFIELLARPLRNYWARRDGRDWQSPWFAHHGPKCMLINGSAGSGGDAFPYYFRQSGLGPLIGLRTWGGLVGISGNPGLVDGSWVSAPTFAFYEKDGTWGIEGHGVDPDIRVVDDPALMQDGADPQLEKAVEVMLRALEENPPRRPDRPPYPDRRGMGLPPADR